MSAFAELLEGLQSVETAAIACLAVAIVPFALRIWTRARLINSFHIDDWAMIGAFLCQIAASSLSIGLVKYIIAILDGKAGVNIGRLKGLIIAGTSIYMGGMTLLKISLGAFFLRIFSVQRTQRYIVIVVVGITIIFSIVCIAFTAATCGAWKGFIEGEKSCSSSDVYAGITNTWSALNAAGDIVFAALSLDALMKIHMRRMTKFYASIVLLIGTAGGVASIIRLVVITRTSSQESLRVTSGVWTLVELCVGITAANLACLRPVLRLLRQKLGSRRGGSESDDESGPNQPVNTRQAGTSHGRSVPSGKQDLTDLCLLSSNDDKPGKDWTLEMTKVEDPAPGIVVAKAVTIEETRSEQSKE